MNQNQNQKRVDYRIAIPTFKRYEGLKKSLSTLEKYGINKTIIDIFVNNEDEYKIYYPLYKEYNIIVGETGMKEIREFIFNYYKEGSLILCMDDDITDLKKLCERTGKLVDIDNLKNIIEDGFNLIKKNKTIMWGVSPTSNPFFMNMKVSKNMVLCGGWFFGVIIDKDCLKLSVSQYEDYERTIKVFKKYGNIIRLNYITAITKYCKKDSGGMNDDSRINIMLRDIDILSSNYKDFVSVVDKKSSIIGVNPKLKNKK